MPKPCRKCGGEVPAFRVRGKDYICDPCQTEKHNEWRYPKMYGISYETYKEMVEVRAGHCDICKRIPAGKLHVDHDHTTGVVRGLLCGTCNRGIGSLGDSIELLASAMRYLDAFSGK